VVRVTAEFRNGERIWRTVGVSTNVVMASIKALVDGYDFALHLETLKKGLGAQPTA
jgi:2-isopropylmalate synthase